jgi:hypothetical protein
VVYLVIFVVYIVNPYFYNKYNIYIIIIRSGCAPSLAAFGSFTMVGVCAVYIYSYVASCMQYVPITCCPSHKRGRSEAGGLCTVHSTPPSPSRAGGWAGVVYAVRHNNNIYYILRTVAYAKPLRSRHVESCTYNTRQVQSLFLGQ